MTEQEITRLRISRDNWHIVAVLALLVIVVLIGGLTVSSSVHRAEITTLKNEHAKALADQAREYQSKGTERNALAEPSVVRPRVSDDAQSRETR